ncbi:cobyrinate a,c-diamide synthase [Alkalihalophilus marmarensis]|uniref:cobyrinate a,c-diamide synthase n=1 Tax=Alkalihalophilus marmarensis TaxID=521377 RepID=UPI002E2223BA|nr:cobyrinate a,c-diamide synthase [Alkalihalophilus marmarensis]MED1601179.1 cobyrinate a,c-diamide synthase [Alkalihalophilus marmarensis]
MQPRFVVTGTDSGVGKTTITLGLMASYKKKGKSVQGYKCGPDYIDPTFHRAITKRTSHQLDTWMTSSEWVRQTFINGSNDADLSIIEGMMGYYDGRSALSDEGSTYEISKILAAPSLLVINISGAARSAAAMVRGFQLLQSDSTIKGVILNQAGSSGHAELCKSAIEQLCQIPVVGYLKTGDTPTLPERQLGLISALQEGEYDRLIEQLSVTIEKQFDLDLIDKIASEAPIIPPPPREVKYSSPAKEKVKIGVAYDEAFHFYYEANLELLRQAGADLCYFSPLKGEGIPADCDGLYLGGGFPEEYASRLSSHPLLFKQLKEAVVDQMPIFAECGGYMLLCESLRLTNGKRYPMAGIIPQQIQMNETLSAIGYREVNILEDSILGIKGTKLRGHEFHYSSIRSHEEVNPCFQYDSWGKNQFQGYLGDSLVASYIHLHFASNPLVVKNIINACSEYKKKRSNLI